MLLSICIGRHSAYLHLRPVPHSVPVQALVCNATLPMLAGEGTPNRPADAMPAKVEAGGQE